jgi:hypothetical protein
MVFLQFYVEKGADKRKRKIEILLYFTFAHSPVPSLSSLPSFCLYSLSLYVFNML